MSLYFQRQNSSQTSRSLILIFIAKDFLSFFLSLIKLQITNSLKLQFFYYANITIYEINLLIFKNNK